MCASVLLTILYMQLTNLPLQCCTRGGVTLWRRAVTVCGDPRVTPRRTKPLGNKELLTLYGNMGETRHTC